MCKISTKKVLLNSLPTVNYYFIPKSLFSWYNELYLWILIFLLGIQIIVYQWIDGMLISNPRLFYWYFVTKWVGKPVVMRESVELYNECDAPNEIVVSITSKGWFSSVFSSIAVYLKNTYRSQEIFWLFSFFFRM